VNVRRSDNGSQLSPLPVGTVFLGERKVLDEVSFQKMISLERKRTERSKKPFLLMLLDAGDFFPPDHNSHALTKILGALATSTRETDVTGWYKGNTVVGVMFTEVVIEDKNTILSTMFSRVSSALRDVLSFEQFNQISVSFHLFPEEWGDDMPQRPSNPTLYPDLRDRDKNNRLFSITKRLMDIVGSSLAILLFAPVFVAIAIAVKLSSKGSVVFKQQRLGQFGHTFTCLKFRSMTSDGDFTIHQEFMKRVIAGNYSGSDEQGKPVFKMTNDPRVTSVGRFLRRTSLDELPQFFNVLKGDMSLVGPRPPLSYEYREYDIWHRRRILEVKPGITGLWQVRGRSRVRFDDMVRLDLEYVRKSSILLDLKILAQTPRAVLFGDGAL
jgi:exopolysaccharide biosynthesis polyprenyl glycosylphosphotransferase